jgi:hypothetical protein
LILISGNPRARNAAGVRGHLLRRAEADGAVGREGARGASEQREQRQSRGLRREVVERHVERRDRGAVAGYETVQLREARFEIERVAADEQPRAVARDRQHRALRLADDAPIGLRFARPGAAVVGPDPDEHALRGLDRHRGDDERLVHPQVRGVDLDGGDAHGGR